MYTNTHLVLFGLRPGSPGSPGSLGRRRVAGETFFPQPHRVGFSHWLRVFSRTRQTYPTRVFLEISLRVIGLSEISIDFPGQTTKKT